MRKIKVMGDKDKTYHYHKTVLCADNINGKFVNVTKHLIEDTSTGVVSTVPLDSIYFIDEPYIRPQ